jgi:hypothetical protein
MIDNGGVPEIIQVFNAFQGKEMDFSKGIL